MKPVPIKRGAPITDTRTTGRIWEVCLVTASQVAACIPGKEHAGRVWINRNEITTAGTDNPGHWRIAQ